MKFDDFTHQRSLITNYINELYDWLQHKQDELHKVKSLETARVCRDI